MTVAKIERALSRFNRNLGATDSIIKQFEEQYGLKLPEDYISFLRQINGGEGFIGANSYTILWRIEDLDRMNKAYEVDQFAPGLLLFGSDGGGEAFAFDIRTAPMAIVRVPFVGLDNPINYGASFDEFLLKLARDE